MLPKRLCTLALVGVGLSIMLGVTAVLGFLSASADEPIGAGSDPTAVEAMQVSQPVPAVHKLPRVAIGAIPPGGVHLVAPREDVVQRQLRDQGVIPADATSEQAQIAVDSWYRGFAKKTQMWVSPQVRESALRREADLADPGVGVQAIQPVTATVLVMAVEFGASETIQASVVGASGLCVTMSKAINGPLQGNIPYPGPQDNNTVWYSPTLTVDPAYYGDLVFGYAGVGRVRYDLTDPDDGQPGINLSGRTVQDYYDQVAGKDNVIITGTVRGWVTVNHSEGHYGAPDCDAGQYDGGDGVPVAQLVIDAVDVFSQTNPTYYRDTSPSAFWPRFDADGNGIVDSFWVIHAGAGQEAEGGAEGQFAIWSHSSDLRNYGGWHDGYQVYEGDPADPDDDIFVGPYTMQPEDAGMGVFAEEFGHSYFGLPDLHTIDKENSVGFWSTMAPGVWGGHLGASAPVGMSLWLRMMAWCGDQYCNWQEPMLTRDYDDSAADITIGQLESTPKGVHKGVLVNLPDFVDKIPNRAGTGKGAYTFHSRDGVDLTLDRQITIGASAPAVLSFDSYWDIEEGWDYGYVVVNGTALADMDGHFTDAGSPGLTGSGSGVLRFDLSAYRGQTVNLSLRYVTDYSLSGMGWWVDNVRLDGVVIDDFSGASAPDTFPGWSNSDPGWMVAPTSISYVSYYLVEWRAATKYDSMLRTAYVTAYSNPQNNEWRVERVPYNIPGALLYYRNQKYGGSYALAPNQYDPPSIGPKYQLLVVDMNYQPMRLGETGPYSTTVLEPRRSSYDAALTLQPTDAFTINQAQIDGTVLYGPWHYASEPAVTKYNDVLGYYAGYYSGDPCPAGDLCFANEFGSAVIPARGRYSTRITDFGGAPLTDLYGQTQNTPGGAFLLGSGNPGDDSVQHGVIIELLSKAGDDSTARLRFRNFSVDVVTAVSIAFPSDSSPEHQLTYRTVITNNGNESTQKMPFTYTLDSLLTLRSSSVRTGGSALGMDQPDGVRVAADQVTGSTPALAPGGAVTIEVVATGSITPGTTVTTRLDVHDGQVPRGPWFIRTTPTRVVMPQIFKDSPMW
jgi:immune inhibitor A